MQEHVQAIDPKLILWLIGLIILWVIFVSVVPENYKPEPTGQEAQVTFKIFVEETQITEKTTEGTNAFDAMQEVFEISYQDYGSLGVMIETIDGISPGQGNFWKLFVNGQEAQLGISNITLEENMTIEWKTEKIQDYPG